MKVKYYFWTIVLFIISTDISILLNIPIMRPFLSFICFTIIPGALIINIVKLNKIEIFKQIVLMMGLSVSLLMIVGLLINELFLSVGYSTPLSLFILLPTFNFVLFILLLLVYLKNNAEFNSEYYLNFYYKLEKEQVIYPIFLSTLFPFIAIFGTQMMNRDGNNLILMYFLFFIPIYVILLIYLKEKVPDITYPIAILMISISLLLIHGLTSNYVNGRDVHAEYYTFKIITANQHWEILNSDRLTSSTLSTSLLPAIYEVFLGINPLYVFKMVFQLIFSITPLVCYLMYKNYLKELYAFLAAFFFMSQIEFIFELQSSIKQEIALLFFSLTIMVYLDTKIDNIWKKVLFIVFMISMILSHYTTSYIFFVLIFLTWIMSILCPWLFKSKKWISFSMLALMFVLIFLWYSSVSGKAFENSVFFMHNTFRSLYYLFINEIESSQPLRLIGVGTNTIVDKLSTLIHDLGFILIGIGVFSLVSNRKNRIDINYISMVTICIFLLACLLVIPYLSIGYGAGRLYQQLLVILAPTLILGAKFINSKFNSYRCLSILVFLLVSQFYCATYFFHQIDDVPISEDLNREGGMYWEYYIHDQEISAANWINYHKSDGQPIYSDFGGSTRILMGLESNKIPNVYNCIFDSKCNGIESGYIYLRYLNVVEAKVQPTGWYNSIKPFSIDEYTFIKNRGKIYSNAGSEVFK